MKSAIAFTSLLKAEYFKAKGNVGVQIILLFPIVITLAIAVYLLYDSKNHPEVLTNNPWIVLMGRFLFLFYAFFYPLVIALFCYSLSDMEYKNQSFKQLFTLPVSKTNIFLAKIVVVVGTVFLSVLIAYVIFLLSGYLMGYILPRYGFQNYDVRLITAVFFFKVFVGVLSITFIQYFFSLIFRNFVLPIGLACFGTIFSLIAGKWKYIGFVPYHSIYNSFNSFMGEGITLFSKVEFINIGFIIAFALFSYFIFMRIKP